MPFQHTHLPDLLPPEPLSLVQDWLALATRTSKLLNPNAMVLATCDTAGRPHARVVLCKEIRPERGYVTFFTNYDSSKGGELTTHPRAAVVFHWDELRRQVRLEGPVTRTTAAESDAYFASRSWMSRIGAWASAQSTALASRAQLAAAVDRIAERFGVPSPTQSEATAPDPGVPIPRPPNWGGFHLWVDSAELWMEGAARLHDRARWTRTLTREGDAFRGGAWQATRLQP